ncbi:uncharacterized protein F5Z01DRAFT_393482 [Emericellopsis atlantica]|uniref:Uncharacterized protein n=1 Tax=Emericellopsis atlantica TaxID=2614577 RepID=A0A9P7ZTR4_9HYPO|nr:uncharacterized protein F5Z01DRAFT_393482 [Emericellopsis atlantica]KAG9257510.1 hypothetical protein F5Z01DRAFT_393482 [Emericellopsis atlantica]
MQDAMGQTSSEIPSEPDQPSKFNYWNCEGIDRLDGLAELVIMFRQRTLPHWQAKQLAEIFHQEFPNCVIPTEEGLAKLPTDEVMIALHRAWRLFDGTDHKCREIEPHQVAPLIERYCQLWSKREFFKETLSDYTAAVLPIRAAYAHAQRARDDGDILQEFAGVHTTPRQVRLIWEELLNDNAEDFIGPSLPVPSVIGVPGLDEFIPQLNAADAWDEKPDHIARRIHPMRDYDNTNSPCGGRDCKERHAKERKRSMGDDEKKRLERHCRHVRMGALGAVALSDRKDQVQGNIGS